MDKYAQILKEFDTIEGQLQDPHIIADHKLLQEISLKHSELQEAASLIKQLTKLEEEKKQLEDSLKTENDTDMCNMYNEEIISLDGKIALLKDQIAPLLKPKDPNDRRNTIIEIRAGTGGEEAALFASDLFRMYTRYAESQGWQIRLLSANYTGNGGFKEVVMGLNGKGVYGKLKYESGVHRVQRVPATESAGRIHTSAASVVILPEIDDLPDIEIKDEDIKIDVYRATGPGGQSVNTTDSAVRITHIPTNIVVTCQDEKSQHKNKARAMSILKSKLYQIEQEKIAESTDSQRKAAIKTGDRSAKIRTYNFPQGRITDHRIKRSWYNLQEVLNGGIDEILSETSSRIQDEYDT